MSMSLYWRRQFKNLRQPNTHYYRVQGLTGDEILAIGRAHQRRDARAQQWANLRRSVARWFTVQVPRLLAMAGIGGSAAALAVYMSMQPVADQLAQDNLELTARLNEWKDVATRSASNEVTINLRGHASEVRRSVKRIAEDM